MISSMGKNDFLGMMIGLWKTLLGKIQFQCFIFKKKDNFNEQNNKYAKDVQPKPKCTVSIEYFPSRAEVYSMLDNFLESNHIKKEYESNNKGTGIEITFHNPDIAYEFVKFINFEKINNPLYKKVKTNLKIEQHKSSSFNSKSNNNISPYYQITEDKRKENYYNNNSNNNLFLSPKIKPSNNLSPNKSRPSNNSNYGNYISPKSPNPKKYLDDSVLDRSNYSSKSNNGSANNNDLYYNNTEKINQSPKRSNKNVLYFNRSYNSRKNSEKNLNSPNRRISNNDHKYKRIETIRGSKNNDDLIVRRNSISIKRQSDLKKKNLNRINRKSVSLRTGSPYLESKDLAYKDYLKKQAKMVKW